MFKKIKENKSMMKREMNIFLRDQIELVDMKNTVSEMKNTCNGNNGLDNAEDKSNDLTEQQKVGFFFFKWGKKNTHKIEGQ